MRARQSGRARREREGEGEGERENHEHDVSMRIHVDGHWREDGDRRRRQYVSRNARGEGAGAMREPA